MGKIEFISFFKVDRVEVNIRPKSTACATVFWFATGVNPRRVITHVAGEVLFALPFPLMGERCGKVTFRRQGRVCN